MDVHRLRLLREFADRGSVGAVADAMRLTPSAVSQQLKVLTREAGIDLLEQDGRGLRLTDAGRALVLRADDVLAAVDRATEEMAARARTIVGTVRLAMFPSAAALLLPGLLTRMGVSGVEVVATDVDVPYGSAPDTLADHDLVLTHRDERAPSVRSPRIRSSVVMREPVDLVVPPGHRLSGQDSVTLDDLADEDWISVRGGFPVDDVLLSLATITGVQPRVVHRINDFAVIEAMVADGHGVALIPRHAVRHRKIHRLEISGVRAARIYEVLCRPGALEKPVNVAVVTALRDLCVQVSQGV